MDQNIQWILHVCTVPTIQQGALISAPILISGVLIRLGVLLKLSSSVIHVLVTLMGLYMLWFFYSTGFINFVILCGLVYPVLLTVRRHKGILIGMVSLTFLLIWYY